MYGITPQESLAGTDWESRKRGSPSLNQTVIRAEDKQEKLVLGIEEVTTPLTQFTQNVLGTSVVTVKPKMKTTQTKMTTQQIPIQPDFYLPDGKGSRLSEVHQIKTTEKSPEGNPVVLLILDNLRAKYNTKFYLLDKYSGYLYAAGKETIGPDSIEEKGSIYPTESTKPIASAPDEFRSTPYHTMHISTIKGTPEAESTWVPMVTSTVKGVGNQTELGKESKDVTRKESEQQIEDEQWEFIKDGVEKMKETRELAQKEQQRLKEEQEKVKEQRAKLEAEEEQRLQEQ